MIGAVAATGSVLLAGGLAAHGAYYRNSFIFGRALGRLPAPARDVALTFDDGPNPNATPRILDALGEAGVHATFFVLGRHAERWPELVRRVRDEGHVIGNHGYHHRKLHFKGPAYVRYDIGRGVEAIHAACGVHPAFFRAPHGFRSPWVNAIAASFGERVVGWTLGVWDSARPGAAEIVRRTLTQTRAGSIVLLHDGDGYDPDGDRMQTADALPDIIAGLHARNYRFTVPPA